MEFPRWPQLADGTGEMPLNKGRGIWSVAEVGWWLAATCRISSDRFFSPLGCRMARCTKLQPHRSFSLTFAPKQKKHVCERTLKCVRCCPARSSGKNSHLWTTAESLCAMRCSWWRAAGESFPCSRCYWGLHPDEIMTLIQRHICLLQTNRVPRVAWNYCHRYQFCAFAQMLLSRGLIEPVCNYRRLTSARDCVNEWAASGASLKENRVTLFSY